MNKLFHWGLIALLFEAAIVVGRAEPSEQTMREASVVFLKAVIGDVLQNSETAKYFPGVKLDGITLNEEKELDGRLARWEYSHGVHYVPADPGMQVGTKPVFESNASIVFSVFVANEQHGHGLFLWNKSYRVLDDSRLVAGFGIETGRDSRDLQKKVDVIIKSHLAAFQKAVVD
jgi:hypothetical protein